MRKFSFLCLLIVISLSLSCSRKPSDETISQDIQKKAAADRQAKDSQVIVETKQGRVTLTGKARTEAARQKVEAIAKEEPGVIGVDDEIAVDESFTPEPRTLGEEVQQAAERTPIPPPPPPKPIVVPAGTALTIRLSQAVGSKTSQPGTPFAGSVSTPITIDGKIAIPAGSDVTGIVKDAKKAGKFKGAGVLSMRLDSITVRGHQYNIVSTSFDQTTKGKGKRTAGAVAGGAGAGAVIGGLAGGGKGAGIGALVGVTAGAIGAATTGNSRDIEFPAESALSFELAQPLTLKPDTSD